MQLRCHGWFARGCVRVVAMMLSKFKTSRKTHFFCPQVLKTECVPFLDISRPKRIRELALSFRFIDQRKTTLSNPCDTRTNECVPEQVSPHLTTDAVVLLDTPVFLSVKALQCVLHHFLLNPQRFIGMYDHSIQLCVRARCGSNPAPTRRTLCTSGRRQCRAGGGKVQHGKCGRFARHCI